MGLWSKRDRQMQQSREDKVTMGYLWQNITKDKPYKGSPQQKIDRKRKTTRGFRGWT
jgi:hypothetical protein